MFGVAKVRIGVGAELARRPVTKERQRIDKHGPGTILQNPAVDILVELDRRAAFEYSLRGKPFNIGPENR